MIRWTIFLFLTTYMTAQVAGIPPQTKDTAPSQASVQGPTPAAPDAPKPTASRFPFDAFQEFSATMVGSLLAGDDRESHIYRSGKLLRNQGTEGLGYYLTDLETFETYGMTKLGCRTDSHPFFRAFPFSAARPARKVERIPSSKETIDGHVCQIEDVTVSGGDLAMPIKLKFWEAEDLQGFPVKIQILNGGGRGIIQYKDIVVGNVDPTLFVRPDHCGGGLPEPSKKKLAARKKNTAPAPSKSQQ